MRLLASTDFALRVLMLLAADVSGRPLSVEALATALGGLSRNHLHKIVQTLGALGLVRTTRGAGGGVMLAVAAADIRVGTLVRQLEQDQAVVECFRGDGCDCTLMAQCRLRGFLKSAEAEFYQTLDQFTVADCQVGLSQSAALSTVL